MELPLSLLMEGVPLEVVDKATEDQLLVMAEVVNRRRKIKFDTDSNATANGIGVAFGGDKK